jgi:hypothetical protein
MSGDVVSVVDCCRRTGVPASSATISKRDQADTQTADAAGSAGSADTLDIHSMGTNAMRQYIPIIPADSVVGIACPAPASWQ